ncbi:MAG: adenylate/guanylate cyclase domain-containing protein [Kiloniellaceae bacterium]
MAANRVERRLAAILAADVVGYSRMVAADEAGALAALHAVRKEILDPSFGEHGGRVVKTMGDGVLVEFASAVDALRCAMAVQTGMAARDGDLRLRVGVNVGDVVIEDGDILGDGVNIAARLESVAEPGGVAISGAVREYIVGRIDGEFRDGGRRELKNIDRPISVWHWAPEGARTATVGIAPLALPDKPSIAVLPFDNMSGDPEQDYFADGVVEALTAALSRIRAFFVIARNSAFAYKGRAVNLREIGRDLGVAYVLEGSVQRAGGRVRITVQLIETNGGSHIWAEKYDGSLDNIFDLQDRITEQVAGALQPSIRLAEVERARRKRPQDLGAYDYTMRAMRHVWMLEKDEATRALELLDKALEIDPDYPLALALAAWCHAQRSVYTWVEDIEATKAMALAQAERAANLSADDPLILAILGTVHTFARHYGAARVLLERAVALDTNAAWAWSRLGWLETYADRPSEALAQFQKALRLSPLDPMNFNNYVGIASSHQVAGDDDAAADVFLRALEERPNAHWIHRNLAPALLAAGREEQARASFDALLAAYPGLTVKRFKDAMVFSPRVLDRIGAQLLALGLPAE